MPTRDKQLWSGVMWTVGIIVTIVMAAGGWVVRDLQQTDARIESDLHDTDTKAVLALREGAAVRQAITYIREDLTVIRKWIEKQ